MRLTWSEVAVCCWCTYNILVYYPYPILPREEHLVNHYKFPLAIYVQCQMFCSLIKSLIVGDQAVWGVQVGGVISCTTN